MRALLLTLLLTGPLPGAGELVVVVNPASGVERLSRAEVVNLFLGRTRRLPSGLMALPVDQPEASAERADFYRTLVGKDLADINAYWARLLFSGQASPPRQTERSEEVLELVRLNKGAVGYVDAAKVDRRVRVVLEVRP